MFGLTHTTFVSFFRQTCSNPSPPAESSFTTFFWSLGVGFFLFVVIAAPTMLFVYFHSGTKRMPSMRNIEVAGNPPSPLLEYDSKYSFELQLQEVLLGSLDDDMDYPYSVIQERIPSSTENIEIENENTQTESLCEICLENKQSWQMFRNNSCSHSFCYECTGKHIEARIQENLKIIKCPGVNCSATLSFEDCRSMISKDMLAKWDLFLCMESVPDSQKLFCPYRNCSSMLIDDSGEVMSQIECPACHRLFCAQCRVPWHSDFTCKEFQKLNAKKGKKDELLFKLLVKKKNWQKCPSCKMHVEKTEGCLHITCRCRYQFCYRCGSRWTDSHTCSA